MPNSPHLYVDISFHGFGHIAQTAPVLNALRQRIPGLHLTVCSAAPREFLESLIQGHFEHVQQATDFGMRMANAVDVLVQESAQDYLKFHGDWERRVSRESAMLTHIAPDLVLSNVSYLALAAAGKAGIPAVGMCSLNWADIAWPYIGAIAGTAEVHEQMLDAYSSAACFIKLQPSMPMPALQNAREVGPVARMGANRRKEINTLLGLEPGQKLVLVGMGGIQMRLPMEQWPSIPGVHWVVQDSWRVNHPDVIEMGTLGMHYSDLLRSCDALITKPGYGSFTEAAVNGTPLLYLLRHDWPKEPYLVDWLKQNGQCLEVRREQLEHGDLGESLSTLWNLPTATPVMPIGIKQAADVIEHYLLRREVAGTPRLQPKDTVKT